MKIGAVSLGWAGQPLPQVMDEIAAMGGECIEINGRPGLNMARRRRNTESAYRTALLQMRMAAAERLQIVFATARQRE